jgi:hypothetical protein
LARTASADRGTSGTRLRVNASRAPNHHQREGVAWSDWQVRTHIRELEELEYLKARSGAWGKEYLYELVGDGTEVGACGLTLTDPDSLREPAV